MDTLDINNDYKGEQKVTPREAKEKIEELTRLLRYEENLQARSLSRKEMSTVNSSKKIEENLMKEIEDLRKFI